MGMGFHGPKQFKSVLAQNRQITFDLLVHRVNDQRIAGGLIE
jgi:hypothetical protein